MRNLKRVLSLALASVMLMGMMVMGASAAESKAYSDQNSIKFDEAVAVMSAVGVFQGADGKFNPTGDLTREAAAKIITYMVMGKEAADGLTTSAAPFTDVAANRWSAGSIAYCVTNGIIAGDGQGNFYPEQTVNGYAFAKMVLGALGYSAKVEGLTGSGWEVNVAKLAKTAKLTSGLSSAVMSKTMTREQAAQMAFNGMKAGTVTYSGGTEIPLGNGQSIIVGATRTDDKTPFYESYFEDLKPMAGTPTDDYGRPGSGWKYGAKTVGTFGKTADFTYTAKTKADDIKADLDDYIVDATDVTPTWNSKDTNWVSEKTTVTKVSSVQTMADLTKNGRMVEVYLKDDVVDTIVVIDTYFTTVSSVNTVSKTATLESVGLRTFKSVKSEDNESLYNALAEMGKDAKVLVTADKGGKVLSVIAPEEADGAYTAKNSAGERTIGGTKYTDSYTLDDSKLAIDGTTYTIYLDTYGYLIGAEVEAASASSYAFLFKTDILGSASTDTAYKAQLMFEDGTREWVEVSSIDNDKITDLSDADDAFDGEFNALADIFTTYNVKSDGTYNLKYVVDNGDIADDLDADTVKDVFYSFDDMSIKKGAANIFGSDNANILGSSKTIFLVKNGTTYSTYTGVKNVPSMDNADGYVLVGKKTLSANVVVITAKDNAVDSSSLVYITSGDHGSEYVDDTTIYTYDAIVKGEITTLKTTKTADVASKALDAGMYNVEYNSDNVGVKLTKIAASEKNVKIVLTADVDNGTITTTGDGNKSYVTADDFKAFVIELDGDVVPVNVDNVSYYKDQDGAYIVMDSDGEFATTLIILEAEAPAEAG